MENLNVLTMDINTRIEGNEFIIGFGISIPGEIEEILTGREIGEIEKLVSNISDIINNAIIRDIKKDTEINLTNYKKTIAREKEIEEKLNDLDKEMEESYNRLSDEYKAKVDKLNEDLDKLKTPEEKAKRVLEELIDSILK